MTKTKKIALGLVAAVTALTIGGTTVVKANETVDYPSIVQRLAERFNLNADEVKQVFAEEHQARQEERRAQLEQRLNEAVNAGTITEAQKQAVLAKVAENQADRPEPGARREMSPQERQAKMEEHRQEMKAWATEIGLDEGVLRKLIGPGPRRGQGFGQNQPADN